MDILDLFDDNDFLLNEADEEVVDPTKEEKDTTSDTTPPKDTTKEDDTSDESDPSNTDDTSTDDTADAGTEDVTDDPTGDTEDDGSTDDDNSDTSLSGDDATQVDDGTGEEDNSEVENKKNIFKKFRELKNIIIYLIDKIEDYKEEIRLNDNVNERKTKLSNVFLDELLETQELIDNILLLQISKLDYKTLKKVYKKLVTKLETISDLFKHLNNNVK